MNLVINCECGWTVSSGDADDVVDRAEQHLRENHPEIAEGLTREDILSMAEEAPSGS